MTPKPRPLLTEEEFQKLAEERDTDALIDALSRFVKAKPGRKRVYDSVSDRSRAHRERQSAKVKALEEELQKLKDQLNNE
jgi:hypothetical protein